MLKDSCYYLADDCDNYPLGADVVACRFIEYHEDCANWSRSDRQSLDMHACVSVQTVTRSRGKTVRDMGRWVDGVWCGDVMLIYRDFQGSQGLYRVSSHFISSKS